MTKQMQRKCSIPALVCLLVLALLLCVGPAQAAGNKNSDRAETLFVYANDVNGAEVLLKAIPYATMANMAHGSVHDDKTSTYSQSYIDAMPTPTYKEGRGVSVSELLAYAQANTSVAGAAALTYSGSDKLYFTCTDGASFNSSCAVLLETERYYYPGLFEHWNPVESMVAEEYLEQVLAGGVPTEVYLATEAMGGRVRAEDAGNLGSIAEYIAANGGNVTGCLSKANLLISDEAFTLCFGQTAAELENATSTYSNVKKWVYKLRLKESNPSSITALGTVADPECVFSLTGNTLTITLNCADENASIYYSTVGGTTTAPLNLYTGPIVVENYDVTAPFDLGVQAVREGYVSSAKQIFNSADIADDPDAPNFEFKMSGSGSPEVGQPFTVGISLCADKACPLYGGEYRLRIPTAYFTLNSVSAVAAGWDYGMGNEAGDLVVTFTYLDIDGKQSLTANTELDIATLNLMPKAGGATAITVSSALITQKNTLAYQGITADNLSLTISGSAVMKGDISGDGVVNGTDAVLLARYRAGLLTLNEVQSAAADINGDGIVNGTDAVLLARYRAGLLTKL